jgi:amino acid adenylation domain-containing protein
MDSKMLTFDNYPDTVAANGGRLKPLLPWKYSHFSSDKSASEIEYICVLICLFYRCQALSSAEIVFHWYKKGRACPANEYTLCIDPESNIDACFSAISQYKCKDNRPAKTPQFVVYSDVNEPPLNSGRTDVHALYLIEGRAYFDWVRQSLVPNLYERCNYIIQELYIDPCKPFSACNVLMNEEVATLLYEFGNDYSGHSIHGNIHSYIESVSASNPDAMALLSDQGSMTFRELNGLANQLACVLLERVGNRPAIIAVDVKRSPNMIVAFLAILKAGCGFLPIDGNAPDTRVHYMIEDCACSLIITDAIKPNRHGVEQLTWDRCVELMLLMPTGDLCLAIDGDTIAYVNYTSGSTGVPKGVEVYHKGVVRLNCESNFITYDNTTRMLQLSNVAFDAATFEIWGALMNACPLVLYNGVAPTVKGLLRHVEQYKANTTFITTSLFNLLADDAPEIFSSLRYVIFGGERASIKHVYRIRALYPHLHLVQAYGPTECTTFATTYNIETLGEYDTSIPIGKPINETQVYLLDEHRHLVPIGVPGEIYIGGSGVARGYRNQEQKTAESFVKLEGVAPAKGIVYRTGDIAYRQMSGDIVFIGRRDDQVKIRGFRIELGEVTDALAGHPMIAQLHTAVIGDNYDDKRIVTYVMLKDGATLSLADLRAYGADRLPKYMMPNEIIAVSELPLTANGKLDKRRINDYRIHPA